MRCLFCKDPPGPLGLCQGCLRKLSLELNPRYEEGPIVHCGRYMGTWRQWILTMKSQNSAQAPHSTRALLLALSQYWQVRLTKLGANSAVAVPSHLLRGQQRASLAEWWAEAISQTLGLQHLPLLQHRWTADLFQSPQKLKNRKNRIGRSHRWTSPSYPPKRILLVDDVRSTGESLNSAQQILEKAGHRVVGHCVLAQSESPFDLTLARP